MLQHWLRRRSIREQMILGAVIVHALLMSVFVVDVVINQRDFLREQMLQRNTALVQGIARHAGSDLLSGDIAALQEIIDGFTNYPELQYAAILDPAGKVLAHTDPGHFGQYMNDPRSRSMLSGPRVARALSDQRGRIDFAMPVEWNDRLIGWVRFSAGMGADERGLNAVALKGVTYAAGAVLLGVLMAIATARLATRRLYELLSVAEATRAGRRDLRAETGDETNEIGRMAGSFNTMLDALSEREKALEQSNLALEARVAARTAALEQSEATQRAILEHANDAFVSSDERGMVVTWNGMAETIFGWPREEAMGRSLAELIVPSRLREAHTKGMARYLATGEARVLNRRIELMACRRDGGEFPVELSLRERRQGEQRFFDAFLHDITERKTLERQLAEQALQDVLTGLPNRRALMAELPMAMARAGRSGQSLAVLFLDLDGFKGVNDAHGHEAGDVVLREFATRLRGAVRQVDMVARLAGDEFVVMAEGLGDASDAREVARKILTAARLPYELPGGHTAHLSSSIGVCLFKPGSGMSANHLLSHADDAMYAAKRAGKSTFQVWDADAPAGAAVA